MEAKFSILYYEAKNLILLLILIYQRIEHDDKYSPIKLKDIYGASKNDLNRQIHEHTQRSSSKYPLQIIERSIDRLYRVGRARCGFRLEDNFPLGGKVPCLLAFQVFYNQVGSLQFLFLSLGLCLLKLISWVKLRLFASLYGMKNLAFLDLGSTPSETIRILN